MSELSDFESKVLGACGPGYARSVEAVALVAQSPPELVGFALRRLEKHQLVSSDDHQRYSRTDRGSAVLNGGER